MSDLIGRSDFSRQLNQIEKHRARAKWEATLGTPIGERFLLIGQGKGEPIIIHQFNDAHYWRLGSDPQQFTFIPLGAMYPRGFETWNYWDFCSFIGSLPGQLVDVDEIDLFASGHFSGIALWLRSFELPGIKQRDEFRNFLHTTEFVKFKPWVDFSLARRRFCQAIYPYSELAQRAASEDFLWICLEYSEALQKLGPGNATKESSYRETASACSFWRDRLREAIAGELPEDLPTIESFIAEGGDWQLHLETLLICDVLRLIQEAEGSSKAALDMGFHLKQFLAAKRHLNWMCRNSGVGVIFKPTSNGRFTPTRKGRPSLDKPKRGRGRPPKRNL